MSSGTAQVEFRKSLRRDLAERLNRIGFARRPGDVFEIDLGVAEVVGWAGFPERTIESPALVVALSPTVGVRHAGVTRLLHEVSPPSLPHNRYAATAAVNIGELLPGGRVKAWDFSAESNNDAGLSAMVSTVEKVGIPFMAKLAGDESYLAEVIDRSSLQADVLSPILAVVAERYDDARARLNRVMATMPASGPFREFYLPFQESLRAEIKSRESVGL